MPVYFIASSQIEGSRISIGEPLAHHLRDVLRVRPGETLEVVDEHRRRYRVAVGNVSAGTLVAEVVSVAEPGPEVGLSLSVAQAVLKGSRMDWMIQKATELGVSTILPVITGRTVVRASDDRRERQRERWQRIALEASQQCGRLEAPAIESPVEYGRWLESVPEAELKLILWEREFQSGLKECVRENGAVRSVLLAVGPEGGFAPEEVTLAEGKGFRPVSLGGRILRAETASLAAVSILQYEFGDLSV